MTQITARLTATLKPNWPTSRIRRRPKGSRGPPPHLPPHTLTFPAEWWNEGNLSGSVKGGRRGWSFASAEASALLQSTGVEFDRVLLENKGHSKLFKRVFLYFSLTIGIQIKNKWTQKKFIKIWDFYKTAPGSERSVVGLVGLELDKGCVWKREENLEHWN
jgi:hypothetical protein